MARCQVGPKCESDAESAWQPFGPDDRVLCFTDLGAHYRGFPVVKCCESHRLSMGQGTAQNFKYKGQWYLAIPKTNTVQPY